ncbi:MAG: isomerase [Cryobacterium sp.]|nr:isomerase [Cryobacterium sp.]
MRLLLIRHGQTPSNVIGALDTSVPGPELTELGQRQAEQLPRALAGEDIRAIYASVQTRAQMTAAPLADALGIPVQVRDGLREIGAGDLEMNNDRASVDLYHEVSFGWAHGQLERRMPGGENGKEVYERFDAVIRDIAAGGCGTAAVVAHGQILRCWVTARTGNTDVAFAARHVLHNTGVIIVEGSPSEGWQAVSWMGRAVGGPEVDEGSATGPGGEPSVSDVAGTP